MRLLLRERDRQPVRRSDVLTLRDVDEPPLMENTVPGETLEPGAVHEDRDVVAGDQVTDQRVQLPAGVKAVRLPGVRPANPA